MALSFTLTPGVIRYISAGDIQFSEGLQTLRSGFQQAAETEPGTKWHLLFDIRASNENRTSSELREIANLIASQKPILSGYCAVCATDPLHYGLSRMFGVFMESLGLEVGIFHRITDAEQWLQGAAR